MTAPSRRSAASRPAWAWTTDAESWRFETYTIEQYEASLAAVKAGELTIDDAVIEAEAIADYPFEKVHIEYV